VLGIVKYPGGWKLISTSNLTEVLLLTNIATEGILRAIQRGTEGKSGRAESDSVRERGAEMTSNEPSAKRALVVEDEPSICQFCKRVLVGEGFEVDTVGDGARAQNMLREKGYDLCLFDIRTPVMDGKQLYQWVGEEHPELLGRVIFITGDLISGDTESFLERAGRPFLPKPFTLDELKTMVSETLGQAGK